MKAKIEGANTPLLNTQILSLTPANADMDDLEVRVDRSWACIPAACQHPFIDILARLLNSAGKPDLHCETGT